MMHVKVRVACLHKNINHDCICNRYLVKSCVHSMKGNNIAIHSSFFFFFLSSSPAGLN